MILLSTISLSDASMPKTITVSKTSRLLPLLIPLAALLLYSPFLHNPLVFDDQYFFMAGNPAHYVELGLQFKPRWLSYFSHGLTFVWFGDAIFWQRVGNLVVHAMSGLALYKFLSCLLSDLGPHTLDPGRIQRSAVFAAIIFVLHPAAVFAAGYLIQRTTLLATFFCLCSWTLFWVGLKGNRIALWASLPAFALAAWSKEHCVMAPALNVCLLIAYMRSTSRSRPEWGSILIVLGGQFLLSFLLVASAARLIGTPYELGASTLIDQAVGDASSADAHLLSVITQSGLFFKYLALWALPDGSRMSIDMREHFATSATSSRALFVLLAFFSWGAIGLVALVKGRTRSLIGIGLLAPWIMFGTEIAALRIQEIFVLYRSYLWMGPLTLGLALLFVALRQTTAVILASVIALALAAFSANKLVSMSHPMLLWDEAATLVEKQSSLPIGSDRIYFNRARAYERGDFISNAIEDYNRAISLNPLNYQYLEARAHANVLMEQYPAARADIESAIILAPGIAVLHAQRGDILAALGDQAQANASHEVACTLGKETSCKK